MVTLKIKKKNYNRITNGRNGVKNTKNPNMEIERSESQYNDIANREKNGHKYICSTPIISIGLKTKNETISKTEK